MDEIATKAIIIGVSIFVTLIIVTVLILEFTQIKELYRATAETDISFEDRVNEFDKYRDSSNRFTGLDVRNTIEKYKNDKSVDVYVKIGEEYKNEEYMCADDDEENEYLVEHYTSNFKVTMDETGNIFKIIFEKE